MSERKRQLFLLRHGEAEASSNSGDHGRCLTQRGMRQAREVAHWLLRRGKEIDLFLVSDGVRAKQTAQIVHSVMQSGAPIQLESDLYLADAEELLLQLAGVNSQIKSVLLLAHNPGLSDLAYQLGGGVPGLPTAGLVEYECEADWAELARLNSQLVRWRWPGEL